jgi:hypothetical protein
VISGFELGVNEICTLLGFCAASIDSFGTTVGGCEILTAVLVKIQVIWHVSPCRLVNLPSSQGQQSKLKALRSTETSVTLHQSTGRNLHQRHVSQNRRPCRAELLCMTRLLRICEDRYRIHKCPLLDIFLIPCIMIY